MSSETESNWERGYRCHGYWIGVVRWGYVGLGPYSLTVAARDGYGWGFTPHGVVSNDKEEKPLKTLRQAKKAVEDAYRRYVAANPCAAGL